MKKIAAHYWLRPDGTVGKFPVITFHSDNRIAQIRERESFEEEEALLLVNGFLIPGLVDYAICNPLALDKNALKKYLNRITIAGIRGLGVPENMYIRLQEVNPGNLILIETLTAMDRQEDIMGFEKIKAAKDSMAELKKLTVSNAQSLGVNQMLGSLEVGKAPGLMAISKLDYSTFCVDKKSKLKIIM
ncbi:hypothetical protein SAMN06265379_10276 [Saccharicrinis carchari]|uniref:Uncharacterized protein n=1 Tax=Saccharicrinis carchari TaxID=1168039 RepID=A0A521BW66_SACCC|nr:hypothetical protein [Saccharicrinis carchari]SMO50861.1 hypothetical protein SAMN06265379_10276 [Saccharicrinis carchari]